MEIDKSLNYYDKLPEEMIFEIIKYLEYDDIKILRLISRRSETILNDLFIQRTRLNIDNWKKFKFSSKDNNCDWLFKTKNKFPYISLNEINFEECDPNDIETFWNHFCDTIIELDIKYCRVNEEMVCNWLKRLPKLKRLNVSIAHDLYGDNIISILFDKVNAIKFGGIEDIRLDVIEKIANERNPTIKELELCHVSCNRDNIEDLKFCDSGLYLLLKKLSKSLKNLHMFLLNNYTEFLSGMSEIEFDLRNLNIYISDEIEFYDFEKFAIRMKNLEHLDISGAHISDECAEIICNNMKRLKGLSFQECDCITNAGTKFAGNLEYLESFEVSSCHNIYNSGIVQGVAKNKNENMKRISLNGSFCDDALIGIVTNFPNLENLLLYTHFYISPKLLLSVFDRLKNLRSLNIGSLNTERDKDMFDAPLQEIEVQLPIPPLNSVDPSIDLLEKLEYLAIDGFNSDVPGISLDQISRVKNLKQLSIYSNHELTKSSVLQIINNCRKLKKFDIRFSNDFFNTNEDRDEIKRIVCEKKISFQFNMETFN